MDKFSDHHQATYRIDEENGDETDESGALEITKESQDSHSPNQHQEQERFDDETKQSPTSNNNLPVSRRQRGSRPTSAAATSASGDDPFAAAAAADGYQRKNNNNTTANKFGGGKKRLFGGGSSGAAGRALSSSPSAKRLQNLNHNENYNNNNPSSQQIQPLSLNRDGSGDSGMSSLTMRSGTTNSSNNNNNNNRRKYLQTIHSERSLNSDTSNSSTHALRHASSESLLLGSSTASSNPTSSNPTPTRVATTRAATTTTTKPGTTTTTAAAATTGSTAATTTTTTTPSPQHQDGGRNSSRHHRRNHSHDSQNSRRSRSRSSERRGGPMSYPHNNSHHNRRSLLRRSPGAVTPGTNHSTTTTTRRRNSMTDASTVTTSVTTTNKNVNTKRANLIASRLASRTTAVKSRIHSEARKAAGGALGVIGTTVANNSHMASSNNGNSNSILVAGNSTTAGDLILPGGGTVDETLLAAAATTAGRTPLLLSSLDHWTLLVQQRRYKPGDSVLVCHPAMSRWSTLVNRFGFPAGEGSTADEQRGPYLYALATVKQVHFEEFAAYYTVVRVDTGAEHRADADFIEPIRSEAGRNAAYRAAIQSSLSLEHGGGGGGVGNARMMSGVAGTDRGGLLLSSTGDNRGGGVGDGREGLLLGHHHHNASQEYRHQKLICCLETTCLVLISPFMCLYALYSFTKTCLAPVGHFLLHHAKLILTGSEPYACQLRLTVVNFIVLCSLWYLFMDQARFVIFPPDADYTVAVLNFLVWLVLFLELLFEVFIRPDGYQQLIVSEKAFSPQTVRFMNAFHLTVELFSLALFIPEFQCLFSTDDSCSDRFRFSFTNAALMAVTGPTRAKSTYGRLYLALVRLRVFGVVRHWKNMWITNTFLLGKKKHDAGWLSSIFPPRAASSSRTKQHSSMMVPAPTRTALQRQHREEATSNQHGGGLGKTKKSGGGGEDGNKSDEEDNDEDSGQANHEHQDKDLTLTNASNIGTGLMVTNSYRAIALLWIITGLFPVFTYSLNDALINDVPYTMTQQLQATNLIANDTSSTTCDFLIASTHAWMMAVVAPDVQDTPDDPYLVNFVLEPDRCNLTSIICNNSSEYAVQLCAERSALRNQTVQFMADYLGVRVGSIVVYQSSTLSHPLFNETTGEQELTTFSVTSYFDQTYSIRTAALTSLILQIFLLVIVLGGLTVLRRDAEVLVLHPLRRMLKIVARYAKNPLVPPKLSNRMRISRRKLSSQRAVSRDDDSTDSASNDSGSDDNGDKAGSPWRNEAFALGSYETEQLIAAVTKITDLLRKCWGVAGADIISTNLATREGALTEVFNPTVPGKSVYALFAFAAINEFDHALRNLGGDVMILINDVASVLHGEVYRWGFGDSGQCNKNLGGAFLMVFRIGLVKEVIKKLEQATSVIFSGSKASQTKVSQLTRRRANKIQQQQNMLNAGHHRRNSSNMSTTSSSSPKTAASSSGSSEYNSTGGKTFYRGNAGAASKGGSGTSYRRLLKVQRSASVKAMSLSLASLPGISTFTDRAVIGMLKSFASIHRDRKLRFWNNDFRLGAGVGAFTVSMIYGMDAGWAVEGAVGSNYKIDATYLSPHVNMASRMMSACKQYGVSILLSQAVQELMSDVARSKLRQLDIVTVKGSSVQQKIYTYDARYQGADFFLHYRTDEQADIEADSYTPKIWDDDPDLNVMRQHITKEFLEEFSEGSKLFLLGEWPAAKRRLEKANELMVENAIESGFLEAELEEIMSHAANPAEAAEELKKHNGDGPSQYLLHYMESYGYVAPAKWEGWHPLNRK